MTKIETLPAPSKIKRTYYTDIISSSLKKSKSDIQEWKGYEKIGFRFFFIYFFIQSVPLDWKFYRDVFSISWTNLHFYDLFRLTRYSPQFFSESELAKWGLASYANWGVVILIALAGAAAWSYADKNKKEYNNLYYWLRVLLRYRLAIGIIAYGFIKLFPLQMPFPSLSNLHTPYGDFLPWKIYWHTIGITQNYESFLGFVEILGGLLLLYRKTVTFGTGLLIGFTGNILAANFAYDGGEHVYCSYLVVIAVFLFAYDVPRLYNLFVKGSTTANRFNPSFTEPLLKKIRLTLKVSFIFFILIFGSLTYSNYAHDPYLIPQTPGLSGAYGYYNVKEFRLNNKVIPYSTTDPDRWQNVVFEKWATISVKIARPVKIDLSNGDLKASLDIDRNYEVAGVGGRHYFSYVADTLKNTLNLQNKNKNHHGEKFDLSFQRPNASTIILEGKNEKGDSIYAVLEKINRKYMLYEGRRKPVKL
jgi:hypothetical protein